MIMAVAVGLAVKSDGYGHHDRKRCRIQILCVGSEPISAVMASYDWLCSNDGINIITRFQDVDEIRKNTNTK